MPNGPPGIFVVATHAPEQAPYLRYLGLGDGPRYVLRRDIHLCHLEAAKTISAVSAGAPELLNNSSQPRYGVCAVAKRDLWPGTHILRAIGSFDVRGSTYELNVDSEIAPIGLLDYSEIIKPLPAGHVVRMTDVVLPESRALEIWQTMKH